jgi:hypothetical protein
MQGSKKFIVVGNAYAYARWYERLDGAHRHPPRGGRIKRSRHRTTVDIYLVQEIEVKWIEPSFGRASAPKWYRRVSRRRYRGHIKELMRHGRYDELYAPPRDGSWYW